MSDDSTDASEREEQPDTEDVNESEGEQTTSEEPEKDEEIEESEEDEEEPDAGVGEDDVVRLAYTARSVDSDTLVDTTNPAVAEEEGIDTEERSIEPRVIPLGAGHLFPSVEADIIGSDVGDSGEAEVPPSEAFGEYDPDNVRTISADNIPEDDRYPGAQVEIDGERGFVETIIGGRARVDFNHPLAGEAIEWEWAIQEVIEDRIEQARGILSGVVDADLELWIETEEEEQPVDEDAEETETVDIETLYVESVPQLALNQQWMFRKQQIAQEIIDRVGVDRVIVQETIEGTGLSDVQAALEDVDVDAEEIAEELEEDSEDVLDTTTEE